MKEKQSKWYIFSAEKLCWTAIFVSTIVILLWAPVSVTRRIYYTKPVITYAIIEWIGPFGTPCLNDDWIVAKSSIDLYRLAVVLLAANFIPA
jgi:hypothetical protein